MNRSLRESVTCRDGGCFHGESSLRSWSGGLSFNTGFLPVTDAVCRAEMRRRVGRTGGRIDAASPTTAVFFSS